jgi:hypothetical protein
MRRRKKAKIQRYLQAVGLQDMFASKVAMQKERSEKLATEITDSIIPRDGRVTAEQKQKIREAMLGFLASCRETFTPERLATVYGEIYGAHVSEADLDGIIAFYESPIGRKDLAAGKAALPEYSNHFAKESEGLLQKKMAAYIAELRKIIGDPCCDKRK